MACQGSLKQSGICGMSGIPCKERFLHVECPGSLKEQDLWHVGDPLKRGFLKTSRICGKLGISWIVKSAVCKKSGDNSSAEYKRLYWFHWKCFQVKKKDLKGQGH